MLDCLESTSDSQAHEGPPKLTRLLAFRLVIPILLIGDVRSGFEGSRNVEANEVSRFSHQGAQNGAVLGFVFGAYRKSGRAWLDSFDVGGRSACSPNSGAIYLDDFLSLERHTDRDSPAINIATERRSGFEREATDKWNL